MDMVKLALLTAVASVSAAASDFSLEIGSPTATLSKVKNASFSIRAKDCPVAKFSGTALSESSSKQRTEGLVFAPGSAPGSFAVVKPNQGYGRWIAVITADCAGTTLGVLVPIGTDGAYDRAAAKFVSHAPTPAEMEAALRALQGAPR